MSDRLCLSFLCVYGGFYMGGISDILTVLGEHFWLILIACVELVAAITLAAVFSRKSAKKKKKTFFHNAEGIMIREFLYREDEVCLLVRREDSFPVATVGNTEGLFGITDEAFSRDDTELFRAMKEPEKGYAFFRKYGEWDGKSPLSAEIEMKNGKMTTLTAVRCHDDNFDIFLFKDITDEYKKEQEYEEKLKNTEEESSFKTSFLFRMSHEIRTPMNGIIGMLELAKRKMEKDHPARQYLDKADELSDQLLALINDILDMSRIEAGKIVLEKRPFSLRAFGSRMYDMFSKTLEAKGVHYEVDYDDLEADWVIGDELRISQVVINFLSNAVKFTSEGEVTVTFRQMLIKDGMLDLMIRVHDTGIGMKPEFISKIFNPFEQEDASTTRKYGGTGLGMAISDQLVKLMGGQIVVDSLPGKGSDFTVFISLPISAEEESETEEKQKTEISKDRNFRILMAEDNEINAMIAVEILNEKGASVDVAGDGKQVVDKFCEMPENYYDAILMDIQMPVMDGRTAARKIRSLERADAATVPVYALSADAFVEDERLSIESGMNGHFSKPIDFEKLWNTLCEDIGEKK